MVRQTFGIEKPSAKIGHRAEMNDRLKSGSGEGDVNGRLWVRLEAGGQGVFARCTSFVDCIALPSSGHSFSFQVCSGSHFCTNPKTSGMA